MRRQGNIQPPSALLVCDSGRDERLGADIGQGHLFRCRSFAAHLRMLGWKVSLLELQLRPAPRTRPIPINVEFPGEEKIRRVDEEPRHYRGLLSPEQLQNLVSLTQLPGWEEFCLQEEQGQTKNQVRPRFRLLVLDSYHLSPALYRSCITEFPESRLLALDDFERFAYPKEFFVLQATIPPVATDETESEGSVPRHLRGLEYQVLRPEFSLHYHQATERQDAESILGDLKDHPYVLLVPGSAFSASQVEIFVSALLGQPEFGFGPESDTRLAVLLSPCQTPCQTPGLQTRELDTVGNHKKRKKRTEHSQIIRLSGLNAAQLRPLYLGASQIFCAAGQSLLEVLALRSPKPEPALHETLHRTLHETWEEASPKAPEEAVHVRQPQIYSLLSADNQEPALKLLRQSGVKLPCMDLRSVLGPGTGADSVQQGLQKLLQKEFSRLAAGQHAPLLPNSAVRRLSDGLALSRVLQKIGLSDLEHRVLPCDNLSVSQSLSTSPFRGGNAV
ncbi:hypothetical protein P0082_10015 [Candidatus Haliotispira prima]|uniref:Uncharacterized protein n=1 Tax=Candidatus Haliotispira prima TaxID=3034016 RepID=A0ABY8MFW5_9SPIO|nr:hypothetical protein P0082_10015 [Candidatus Haliotispira prima]